MVLYWGKKVRVREDFFEEVTNRVNTRKFMEKMRYIFSREFIKRHCHLSFSWQPFGVVFETIYCVSYFPITVTEHIIETTQRRNNLFGSWLETMQSIMAGMGILHISVIQEAERTQARTRTQLSPRKLISDNQLSPSRLHLLLAL